MDDLSYSNEEYMENLGLTVRFLAKALKNGSLALVLGAGASHGIGLPEWHDLVNKCLETVGLPNDVNKSTSNDVILQKMDLVEKKCGGFAEYQRLVQSALYFNASITGDLYKHELLIAIGALLIASRRGKVSEILSFNFDNIIEYYLKLYGLKCDIIVDVPCTRKEQDVTVYHPHGYLPIGGSVADFSKFLVLNQLSYDERMGERLVPWRDLTRDFFERKVCIFIGMSGNDPAIRAIVHSVDGKVKSARPTGFWLFGHEIDNKALFLDRNIVPLCFPSFDDYPHFLLEICQKAAAL